MEVKQYDYIVIGGGSGGVASTNRAAIHGVKIILFEAKEVSGTCVNLGYAPRRVMWYSAQVVEVLNTYTSEYGFQVGQTSSDFKTLKASREAYIDRIHASYGRGPDNNGVKRVYDCATFAGARIVEVTGACYTVPYILITTSGHALYPDIPGAQYGITSDGLFGLDEVPKHTAAVGIRYIAVEVAGVLRALDSKTHLFARHGRPLRTFDKEIIDALADATAEGDPTLHTLSIPKKVIKNDDGSLTLILENGETYTVDTLVWAIGRKINAIGFGLGKTDVELDDKGFIKADDCENTLVDGICAPGDVNSKLGLTSVAIKTGHQPSGRLFNDKPSARMNYEGIATVILSHPVIGSTGYSEERATAELGEGQIRIYRSSLTPVYTVLGSYRQSGKTKPVTLGRDEEIINLHGIGCGVDEMVRGLPVTTKMGATKEGFDNTVAIHSTGSEEFVTMRWF